MTAISSDLSNLQNDFNKQFLENPMLIDCNKISMFIQRKQERLLKIAGKNQSTQDLPAKFRRIQILDRCNLSACAIVIIAFVIIVSQRYLKDYFQKTPINTEFNLIPYCFSFQFCALAIIGIIFFAKSEKMRTIAPFMESSRSQIGKINQQFEKFSGFIKKFQELVLLIQKQSAPISLIEDVKEEKNQENVTDEGDDEEESKVRFNLIIGECIRSYAEVFEGPSWNKRCYQIFFSMAINNLKYTGQKRWDLQDSLSLVLNHPIQEESNSKLYEDVARAIQRKIRCGGELSLSFLEDQWNKLKSYQVLDIRPLPLT